MKGLALCIATIPGREVFLHRALKSVYAQTRRPDEVRIVIDTEREGAAATRNRALAGIDDWEWVGFLDDDDELLSHHFEHLLTVALATNADLVYPWFEAVRGNRVIPDTVVGRGELFDPVLLKQHNCIPPEIIVKKQLVMDVGGFPQPNSVEWPYPDCEDWGLWQRLSNAGAHIVHTPEITWRWHHHDQHTRGLGHTPS